jgi:hypothetical protein
MQTVEAKYSFKPAFQQLGKVEALPTQAQLKLEPMFYQSSIEFVRKNGGPITQQFLDLLPLKDNVLIDIRTHKLSPGMYPAIPGYHLDWLPRINKGQDVDLGNIPDYEHVILIVGLTSLTEYLDRPIDIPPIPDNKKVWPTAFSYVNEFIHINKFKTWRVESGRMVYFTSRDWHTASPAEESEWRFFIRASSLDKSRYQPVNAIRTQSQVYIPIKEAIW